METNSSSSSSSSTEKEIMETNSKEKESDVKTIDNVDTKKLPLPFSQTTMGYAPPMIYKTSDLNIRDYFKWPDDQIIELGCDYPVGLLIDQPVQPMMTLEEFKAGLKQSPLMPIYKKQNFGCSRFSLLRPDEPIRTIIKKAEILIKKRIKISKKQLERFKRNKKKREEQLLICASKELEQKNKTENKNNFKK